MGRLEHEIQLFGKGDPTLAGGTAFSAVRRISFLPRSNFVTGSSYQLGANDSIPRWLAYVLESGWKRRMLGSNNDNGVSIWPEQRRMGSQTSAMIIARSSIPRTTAPILQETNRRITAIYAAARHTIVAAMRFG